MYEVEDEEEEGETNVVRYIERGEEVKMVLDTDKVDVVQAQLQLETRKAKREKTRTMKNKDIEEIEQDQEEDLDEEDPSGRFRLTCERVSEVVSE